MTRFLQQSPRDKVLWVLSNRDGKMELGKLQAEAKLRYAILTPVILVLVKEGKIKMDDDIITL